MAKKKAASPKTTMPASAPSPATINVKSASGRAIDIDVRYMLQFLTHLLNTPSPSGYTAQAIHFVRETFANLKLDTRFNTKGTLIATWQGKAANRARALTAHVDTLGAMIKELDQHTGWPRLSKVGSFAWNSVEGDSCSIYTEEGRVLRGTILPRKASVHVHGGTEVERQERSDQTMEIRVDARIRSRDDAYRFGLGVGDFVAFDPRVEVTDTGYIRSRHLDDKAGVACIVGACKALLDAGLRPSQRTTFLITHFEEVGHGAATGLPNDVKELLAVDMAAVGTGQNSDEHSVGICVKDSGGPYSFEMRRNLIGLAQAADIPYKLDIYPFYNSDGGIAWRAGADVLIGLVGPGVDASHSYERTHIDSLVATVRLLIEFMLS